MTEPTMPPLSPARLAELAADPALLDVVSAARTDTPPWTCVCRHHFSKHEMARCSECTNDSRRSANHTFKHHPVAAALAAWDTQATENRAEVGS